MLDLAAIHEPVHCPKSHGRVQEAQWIPPFVSKWSF